MSGCVGSYLVTMKYKPGEKSHLLSEEEQKDGQITSSHNFATLLNKSA